MQIVIPMSGFGERFRCAGYSLPKPLIDVDGAPIIDYVVKMFPGEINFLFICNEEHLNQSRYDMAAALRKVAPGCKIVGIRPHKLGPVHAVLQAEKHLAKDGPIIVNYCDFTCDWDYGRFLSAVNDPSIEGCIPCYRGFHPHTIWNKNYAYVETSDGASLEAIDIQEKLPFTDDHLGEFASSGTYYFKTSDLFRQYARKMINQDLQVEGEYYVSLVYKSMMRDGKRITIFPLDHFMQWGTPADLEEYQYWSAAFRGLSGNRKRPSQPGVVMVPMVGYGSRFAEEGYAEPKPLIEVAGQPMSVRALSDLPATTNQVFVLREDQASLEGLKYQLSKHSSQADFVILDHMTDGQATTCMEAMSSVPEDACLTIAACDNGMIYDGTAFERLLRDDGDVIVWGARGYPGARRRPQMYGWIDCDMDTGQIERISVKRPLADPTTDPIVVGAFTFKHARDFLRAAEHMRARDGRVNGEFYVDEAVNDAIELGLKCRVFMIDHYLCWGTPQDLRTFEYWRACFAGWDQHPYQPGYLNDL